MTRRRRTLTAEESELWARVKATAKPLRPSQPSEISNPPQDEATKTQKSTAAGDAVHPALPQKPERRPKSPPPAAQLDRKTVRNITRGHVPVEKRLDLHGMTQSHAHRRLKRFLEDSQASGAKTVLVITGKGAPDDHHWDHTYQGRGILRRSVPDWLRSPDFRDLVSGFSEASRRHGGGGALYVRIKRRA